MKYKVTRVVVHIYNKEDKAKSTTLIGAVNVNKEFDTRNEVEDYREQQRSFYTNIVKKEQKVLISLTLHEPMNRIERITYEFSKIGTVVMNESLNNKAIQETYSNVDFDKVTVDKDYGIRMINIIYDMSLTNESKDYLKEIKHLYIVEFENDKPQINDN